MVDIKAEEVAQVAGAMVAGPFGGLAARKGVEAVKNRRKNRNNPVSKECHSLYEEFLDKAEFVGFALGKVEGLPESNEEFKEVQRIVTDTEIECEGVFHKLLECELRARKSNFI